MSPTRLSALDASFLTVETPTAPMHVGWAAVFDPPEDSSRPTFSQLRDHIATRLSRAPRYRQRLEEIPFGVNDPVWIDDGNFDVSHHVLEAGSTDLDEIVSMAASTPLEHTRPMWECWVAPRLDDGRVAVVGKAHHSMVDGLAAVELASLLLDPTPDPPPVEDADWHPAQPPGRLSLLTQGLADRVGRELGVGRTLARVLATPRGFAERVEAGRRAAAALTSSLGSTAASAPALNPELSPHRHLARLARPMDDLVRVKRRFGTTINDVILAACSGGVRRFLEDRGEPAVALRAMVPVSLRDAADARGLGNRISFLFIDLPTDEPDPLRRLRTVHGATSELKETGEAEGAELVMNAMSHAPQVVQRAMARLAASPRTFNLVVSNIPGPPAPMWMRGCRLREAYPIVPLADRHALAIGVTSLPDGVFFGLYADRKMLPEADAIAACIGDALDELLAVCGPRAAREDGQPEPVGVT